MIELLGKYTCAKVFVDNIEPGCLAQIIQMINHPAFEYPVRIMPDTHAGKGSVIGFTMKLKDKVVPNVVGVDVGCGILSVNLDIKERQISDLKNIDNQIRRTIPFGMHLRKNHFYSLSDLDSRKMTSKAVTIINHLCNNFNQSGLIPDFSEKWILERFKKIGLNKDKVEMSIGTHFYFIFI